MSTEGGWSRNQGEEPAEFPADIDFRILGPLEVFRAGGAVDIARPTLRRLLARLLIDANRVIAGPRLIEDLWPAPSPSDPRGTLHNHVYRLRRALALPGRQGDLLLTAPTGYAIQIGPHQFDRSRFEIAVKGAEAARASGDLEEAAEQLHWALGLWRGAALAEFAKLGFAQREITRLTEMRLSALEELAEIRMLLGRHRQAVADLEAITSANPLRERAWSRLMLALYRSGRPADALRAYQRLRVILARGPGLAPSPEVSRLEGQILAQDPCLDWVPPRNSTSAASAPASRGRVRPRPPSLPRQLTSFIGRMDLLAAVKYGISAGPLVSLTGAAGCGKSRVALKVAEEIAGDFPDGVWMVDLARVTNADGVPRAVAHVLRVRERPGQSVTEAVTRSLSSQAALVILDNCEHAVAACTELVEAVLAESSAVRLLVTSREWLAGKGDTVIEVPPLAVPPLGDRPLEELTSYESVQLFVARAQAADPGFTVNRDNVEDIAAVCRRLDGFPLALELAAARVPTMEPAEIVVHLGDRLDFLEVAEPGIAGRHQTLRSALDWSHDLLPELPRASLRRLGVFAGGFTVAAAEAVCCGDPVAPDQVADLIVQLVSRSLVVKERVGGQPRYRLLETIRVYALERLDESGELPATRARHRDWCVALAEHAERELSGPEQGLWLQRLAVEHDNLRGALAWADADLDSAEAELRLAGALSFFWFVRGFYAEGLAWLERALKRRSGVDPSLVAKALWGAGVLAALTGDATRAQELLDDSLRLGRQIGDRSRVARALDVLAMVATFRDDLEGARKLLDESIAAAREAEDAWCLADALGELGWVHWAQGDYRAAHSRCSEGLSIARSQGDRQGVRMALLGLALSAYRSGDLDTTEAFAREGIAVSGELGDVWFSAYFLCIAADAALARGQGVDAGAHAEEALSLARQANAPMLESAALHALSAAARIAGKWDQARRHLDDALATARKAAVPSSTISPILRAFGESALIDGEMGDGQPAVLEAVALAEAGQDAFSLARSQVVLAMMEGVGHNFRQAFAHIAAALVTQRRLGDRIGIAESCNCAGILASQHGEFEKAIQLLACSDALGAPTGASVAPWLAPHRARALEATHRALDERVWQSAWNQGRTAPLDDVVESIIG